MATRALITCFNLPTADWASICHSKSVIARAVPAPPPLRGNHPRASMPAHHGAPRGRVLGFEHRHYLSYCSFSTFTLAFRLPERIRRRSGNRISSGARRIAATALLGSGRHGFRRAARPLRDGLVTGNTK